MIMFFILQDQALIWLDIYVNETVGCKGSDGIQGTD